MAFRAYTFEDCITACASQSTNLNTGVTGAEIGCGAVAYKPDSGSHLTCWLKAVPGTASDGEVESQGVDGAVVVQNRRSPRPRLGDS